MRCVSEFMLQYKMLKTETTNKTLVNSKINTASNVFNIISSVFAFVIFCLLIIKSIDNIKDINDKDYNTARDFKVSLSLCCSLIPLLFSSILKFVFDIINEKQILQFKIVQNGLLLLILSIVLLVLGIVIFLLFCFDILDDEARDLLNRIVLFISSLICLACAVFAIVQRIRGQNQIHLFFLIFNTIVIVMAFALSIIFLITLKEKQAILITLKEKQAKVDKT